MSCNVGSEAVPDVQLRDLEYWRLMFIMCLGTAKEIEHS